MASKKRGTAIPKISHRTAKPGTNWLAVVVAVASLITQIGVVILWGGRIDARMGTAEKALDKHDILIREIGTSNAKQDTSIASNQVAYADIIRRLDSIERKLDDRR